MPLRVVCASASMSSIDIDKPSRSCVRDSETRVDGVAVARPRLSRGRVDGVWCHLHAIDASSKSRDRKFLNEGRNEGGKGLTKSRRLELLARARLLQKLGQRRLGDIRSVREVVGAVVI